MYPVLRPHYGPQKLRSTTLEGKNWQVKSKWNLTALLLPQACTVDLHGPTVFLAGKEPKVVTIQLTQCYGMLPRRPTWVLPQGVYWGNLQGLMTGDQIEIEERGRVYLHQLVCRSWQTAFLFSVVPENNIYIADLVALSIQGVWLAVSPDLGPQPTGCIGCGALS